MNSLGFPRASFCGGMPDARVRLDHVLELTERPRSHVGPGRAFRRPLAIGWPRQAPPWLRPIRLATAAYADSAVGASASRVETFPAVLSANGAVRA